MHRGAIMIGTWRFDPAAGELVRGDERRRLEDRSARTLALLCGRRGEVVSQDEIVAVVWSGRRQSANSLAIVIGDLRRALDDDAQAQRYIETVTKRGYRLRPPVAEDAGPAPAARSRFGAPARALAAAGLVVASVAAWAALGPPGRPTVRIEPVVNATGERGYDALSRSVESLVATDLQAKGRVVVLASGAARRPDLVVRGRLILWTGHPALALTASDAKGVTTWSGLAPGPEAALPRQVDRALDGVGGAPSGRRG